MRSHPSLQAALEAQRIQGEPWECWKCHGGLQRDGYKVFSYKCKPYRAHVVAFELSRGRPVQEGMEVMHSCDEPSCVNPAHLEEGTHRENMRDAWEKGRIVPPFVHPGAREKQKENALRGDANPSRVHSDRMVRGEAHHNAKLNDAKVEEILRLREEGWTQQALGEKFGVSHVLIGMVVRGEIWVVDGWKKRHAPKQKRGPYQPKPLVCPQKGARGEANGLAKLNWEKVREIRRRRAEEKITLAALAKEYGVSEPVIGKVVRNQTWIEPSPDL